LPFLSRIGCVLEFLITENISGVGVSLYIYIYMKRKGEDSWLEVEPNKDGVQEVVHLIVNDHMHQCLVVVK
jgi:hypothetical protein